jgi:hypothetical protein
MHRIGGWRLVLGLAAFGLACAATAGPLASQELAPGARVRVYAPDSPRGIVATVMSRTPDAITVAVPVRSVRTDSAGAVRYQRLEMALLPRLDVSLGPSRLRGARRGVLVGLALGAVSTVALSALSYDSEFGPLLGAYIGVLGTGAAMVIGGAVGSFFGVETWERVTR